MASQEFVQECVDKLKSFVRDYKRAIKLGQPEQGQEELSRRLAKLKEELEKHKRDSAEMGDLLAMIDEHAHFAPTMQSRQEGGSAATDTVDCSCGGDKGCKKCFGTGVRKRSPEESVRTARCPMCRREIKASAIEEHMNEHEQNRLWFQIEELKKKLLAS